TQNTPGTTHGYPLADSVRATFYVSGPGVRRGARVQAPCRLADLTPTILELTGTNFKAADFDGRPLRNIYATATPPRPLPPAIIDRVSHRRVDYDDDSAPVPYERPMYWRDIDLHAWTPLTYKPLDPYGHVPFSINNA